MSKKLTKFYRRFSRLSKMPNIALAGIILSLLPAVSQAQNHVYIEHKPTGYRFYSCSNVDGEAITAAAASNNSTCAQWEQVPIGDFFFLKNRESQKHIRPDTSANESTIVLRPSTWTGNWAQWSIIDTGDGYGHLVNRATQKYVFIADNGLGENLLQQPSAWKGDFTRWRFTSIGGAPGATPTAIPTSAPTVTAIPTTAPTATPTLTVTPTTIPTVLPTSTTTTTPTAAPTASPTCQAVTPTLYEAENGVKYGGAQNYLDQSASGGSGVAFISSVGAGFNVSNVINGSQLQVSYASQMSGNISVRINSTDVGNIAFTSTGDWTGTYETVNMTVDIPENATVDIFYDAGDSAINVDSITIIPSSCGGGGSSGGGGGPTTAPTPLPGPSTIPTPGPTPAPTPSATPTNAPIPSSGDFCLTHEGNGAGKITHVDRPFTASFSNLCFNGVCSAATLDNGVWIRLVTGLTEGTTYSIGTQIQDNEIGQCSINADVVYKVGGTCVPSSCLPPDEQAPTTPTGVTGEGRNGLAIALSWNASSDNKGVTRYEVFRDSSSVTSTSELSFIDQGLTTNTQYSYQVRACDEANNCSSLSNPVIIDSGDFVLDTVPPNIPTGLSGSASGQEGITLSWHTSTDGLGLVENYIVYRNENEVGQPTGTTFSDSGLTAGTQYNYRVAACDDSGNCSEPSSIVPISTKSPPTPAPTPAPLNLLGSSNNDAAGMIEVNGDTITTRLAERFRSRHESDTIHDQYVNEYADGSSYEIVLIDRPDALEVQIHSPQTPLSMVNFAWDHILTTGFADPPQYRGAQNMHKGSLSGPADDKITNLVNSLYFRLDNANGQSWAQARNSDQIVTLEFTPRRVLNGNTPQYYSDILRYRPGKGGLRFERDDDRYFSAGPTTNFAHGSTSYEFSQAYMGIDQVTMNTFTHGREIFRASFLGTTLNGLGGTVSGADPDAAADSCIDCHFQLGKGAPPNRSTEERRGFINSGQDLRVAPQLIGLGLLDAVPDSTLQQFAAQNGGRMGDGRYGWKASAPEIEDQVVKALANDMGVKDAPTEQILALGTYIRALGVPIRRHPDAQAAQQVNVALRAPDSKTITDSDVLAGESAFNSAGCNSCHIPEMQTGNDSPYPQFHNITIRPFTDMLLHDMGPELCAASGEGSAGPCEWRTAPLWGTRLQERVTGHATFLHDGRATTRDQAIRAHGGNAQAAKDAYVNMSSAERNNLILYLRTL